MLQVKFYGVRGSISVSGEQYTEFGSNTTCIQLMTTETGRIGVLDAGTGIRDLGKDFIDRKSDQKDIFIAFSHFHWDHIQGFPFFLPAYDPEMEINILAMGDEREIDNIRDIFDVQMQERYFPVSIDEMGATFNFIHIAKDHATFMPPDGVPVNVVCQRHSHPGAAYSYRYEREGLVVTICTDIEHGDSIDQNIVELARGSDILIHEAQYTEDEYSTKRGWGHSTYEQAIEVARQAGVKQLVITHHDPDHDDAFLREQEARCQAIMPNLVFTREGMTVDAPA